MKTIDCYNSPYQIQTTTKEVNNSRNAEAILMMGFPAEVAPEASGQANSVKLCMLVLLSVISLL